MKKALLVITALVLIAGGYFLMNSHINSAQAAENQSNLVGIAFIAVHGGHLAVVNLATLKPPTNIEKDRVVITEAGSEMEGKVAGLTFEQVKKAGGTHGAALVNGKLYVGLLDGSVVVYDLATGKKSKQMKVGQKFCGAIVGPDGKHIYFEDMANGHVYEWDFKTLKTVDEFPVGAGVCGIAWTRNHKTAYVSDMPAGIVYVLDWKTKKVISKITDPRMTFLHQISMTPDGKQLWVTCGNEFDPGLKPGTHTPGIAIIDTKTNKVVDFIETPNRSGHHVVFSPDGKTALYAARSYDNDSKLMLINTKTHAVEKEVSVCASCHVPNGIEVRIDKGSPLLCGITVAWGMKHKPVAQ
ncbi:MAG: YncE family protein [Nitrospiraceae bacterium]|nr:YncE family protein [Nitrospiraceae bacterium]